MNSDSKDCDCSIELLQRRPFKSMKLEEKLFILEKGKPTPDLKLETTVSSINRKNFTRHFNTKLYDSLSWLCGCVARKKLFCWPCLLFSKEETIWSSIGYGNLQNIAKSEKRHGASVPHIIALKEMKKFTKVFGKNVKSKHVLSVVEKKEIELHNLKVQKNRFAFKHLAKVVGSLGKLGVDLECDGSPPSNKVYLEETLRLVSSYNTELKFFMLENSDCIMSQVKKIPSALSECLISEIKKEISQASYLSLILDGVTDSANKDYVCATLRYIKDDDEIIERLVRYWETPSPTSSDFFDNIQQLLSDFNCTSRLVSYSYDNAVVIPAQVEFYEDLNARMKIICKNTVSVHYFAHDLVYIILKSVSHIERVRLFFAALSTFGDFFYQSQKRLEFLRSFDRAVEFQMENPLQLAESVYENRLVLLNTLISVMSDTSEWEASALSAVPNLLRLLRDFDFHFILSLFASIHKQVNVVQKGILSNLTQPHTCYVKVACFLNYLTDTKSNFYKHLKESVTTTPRSYFPNVNTMVSSAEERDHSVYGELYTDILEPIYVVCHERFKNYDKLDFFCLLDRKQFKMHHLTFPQKAIATLLDYYPKLFDMDRLKNELSAIYSDLEFRSVFNLHGFISFQELEDVFPQTLKLSRMLWTMPLAIQSTTSTQRIRAFLKNQCMSKNIFMTIEKDLLENLLEQEEFLEKVVDKLAITEKRYELLHKSLQKEPEDGVGSKQSILEPKTNIQMATVKPSKVVDMDSQDLPVPKVSTQNNKNSCKMEQEEHLAMTCVIYHSNPQVTNSSYAETESSSESYGNGSLFQPPVLIKEEIVSSEED